MKALLSKLKEWYLLQLFVATPSPQPGIWPIPPLLWIGSTQTSRPFVHFSYLSSFTCYLSMCFPTNWFVSCTFKLILFCFVSFSPLRYSLLPQVSHGPVPSPTHRNPHMAWAARNSPSSIAQIHNMALFLCAVCRWQSVTHGGGQETFINQPNEDQQATWLDFPSRSTLVFIICPYFKDIELYIRNQLKSTEVYDSHCILRIQVISLYLPPLKYFSAPKMNPFQ